MGSKRNIDMSTTTDTVKVLAAQEPIAATTETDAPNETQGTQDKNDQSTAKKAKRSLRPGRSNRYQAARAQVDKTKFYDPFAAIELIKRLSYSKFDGTIEAHAVVREAGLTASVTFPHSTGKSISVAIASEELLKEIETGSINFDILIASPDMMPKLTKLARILGPRGLMPNPKSGTLTVNPEKKKKELEGGTLTLKTEKKAPLMHTTIGKTAMETKDLVENLQTLIKALKGQVLKLTISASMSPGVKVEL